ncbi:ABC transporter ATP-binding protein [Insolitispirillum peregrinum]|uniref:Putative spermidine/putrescine transport system ATP-binding protein n=1 Tax=Insolitispirillum peregrinum TaxID=80876 RepID=A0A1N7IHL8_9PROT|nr:ABC transporter ATP-binding protein [Insolitispirillum peregrinum]SIS36604.1 putative spermidine/putrescine transport system ATP-binding protein [Insolitispirillum peregrinum]
MPFLELDNLTKQYGHLYAVENVSLTVEQGEFISLLGPSGCGKTTTLQMIAGFVEATAGAIRLQGRDITHAPANSRGLGIVFQSYALFPHMTVAGNVSFGLEMQKVSKAERARRVDHALTLVHLDAYADRYPRELSGGQRQRVALARALVIQPPLLLLDEPLSNLDAKLREAMQFELRNIQQQVGTTTIMVTHDQAEAFSVSDRVVVMQSGKVMQIDTPYQVYEHPATDFISRFVGKTNMIPSAPGHPQRHIRPEKLRLVAAGSGRVNATVAERFFLGSQWFYHLTSDLGELTVTIPNDGSAPQAPGTVVGVQWDEANMRTLAEGRA